MKRAFLRTRLLYLMPVSMVYTLGALLYSLLGQLGWTEAIDDILRRVPLPINLLTILLFGLVIESVARLDGRHKWLSNHRWLLDMGSRRGLQLGRVSADIVLAIVGIILLQVFSNRSPALSREIDYILLPLIYSFVITVVFNSSDPLNEELVDRSQRDVYITNHLSEDIKS